MELDGCFCADTAMASSWASLACSNSPMDWFTMVGLWGGWRDLHLHWWFCQTPLLKCRCGSLHALRTNLVLWRLSPPQPQGAPMCPPSWTPWNSTRMPLAQSFTTSTCDTSWNHSNHFDATSAGYKAFGQWGGGRYPEIVANLRSVIYFLEARYGISISYFHVKGHSSDPGNEAANTVAQCKGDSLDCYSTWLRYFDCHQPDEIHWLWALWKPEWAPY